MRQYFITFFGTLLLALSGMAMAQDTKYYRSVTVVIMNESSQPVYFAGAMTNNRWGAPSGSSAIVPTMGRVIAKDEKVMVFSGSTRVAVANQGYLELAGAKGRVSINWQLPWVGPFKQRVQSNGLPTSVEVNQQGKDQVILFVTLK